MMHACTCSSARGLTLLEAVLTVLILSIVAGVVTPVIVSATDNYAAAADARQRVERAASALDRVVRLLRETPLNSDDPALLGITSFDQASITFNDNRALAYDGGVLTLTDRDGRSGPLCDEVSSFVISILGTDGLTPVAHDTPQAHVFEVRLTSGGVDLRTRVLPRVRMTGGG